MPKRLAPWLAWAICGLCRLSAVYSLVTVLSTLVTAALFVPLRHRVQVVIDRRLYRRKYDAARTLAAFSSQLRDETNLDHLSLHLLDVVNQTMQPENVNLWLAPGGTRRESAHD